MTAYALPTPDGAPSAAVSALTQEATALKPVETASATTQAGVAQAGVAQAGTAQPGAANQTAMSQTAAGPAVGASATGLQTAAAAKGSRLVIEPASARAPMPATPEQRMASAEPQTKPNPLLNQAPLGSKQAGVTLPDNAAALVNVETVKVSAPAAGRQPVDNMVSMAVMESTFDTGEPVGLETLVAKRMIVPVPMPKPGIINEAYSAAKTKLAELNPFESKPANSRVEIDRLIAVYAKQNSIPEELVHRVVRRESGYNPRAYHRGNYGLMQIRYATARGLGYDGPAEGLFDAETNLKYATRYLRGAWMVADNQKDGAVRLYASGYYNHAKRKGMLDMLDMR
ncbi:lytic transglycosylase domain-containing protein [Xaviernesmea oryzae]|uniref:lytic transglycosylase domain-containing protein n=1 Tax=Xaviernesmea oryzae TaxID=464029 RepID=UPI0009500AD4|nr:lytic transglycosylase domain-containing protein [Xaviernesmea oryzae]